MTYVVLLTDGINHVPVAVYSTRSGVDAFIASNPPDTLPPRVVEAVKLFGVALTSDTYWYKIALFVNDSVIDVEEREPSERDWEGIT